MEHSNFVGFENEGRGHEPRAAGSSRNWERQSNRFHPRDSRKKPGPADILIV